MVTQDLKMKIQDLEKSITTIELDREGLYFVSIDKSTGLWVYVDAVDRYVRVFNNLMDALRHGLNNEIVDVEIVERKSENFYGKQYIWFKVKICTVDDCDTYRAWWE